MRDSSSSAKIKPHLIFCPKKKSVRGMKEKNVPLPDYGLYLVKQQHIRQEMVHFLTHAIDHLTVISRRKFTTVIKDCFVGGCIYSASMDLKPEILAKMLCLMSSETEKLVLDTLAEAREFPTTIQFPAPVLCAIEARLGILRFCADGMFVPFKITAIRK